MQDIKVLVADDESTVRAFIHTVIRKENLPVAVLAEAENGLEAVSIASELKPDLIFLDIRMPGLDGIQVAERLAAADCQADIVIVSAYNDFEYARAAFKAGVADYLLKPVRPGDIAGLIKKTAEKHTVMPAADQSPPGEMPALVKAVNDYVAEHLSGQLNLREVARAVFVSPYHLSRTFKYLTGQSIVEYIQEQRLLQARTLLVTTDLSVTEVAAAVGFNNAAYFATCFKNRMGSTPMQYRKNARN